MTKVSEHIDIEAAPGLTALMLRRPDAIGRFPGVEHAYIGHPGLRMQVRIEPMGIPLHDSVVLAWGKDRMQDDVHVYPFRVEGGRWLHGTGEMTFKSSPADTSTVGITWAPEIPATLSVVPGMRRSIRRWLKRASREWLATMKQQIEPTHASNCARLNFADVGA